MESSYCQLEYVWKVVVAGETGDFPCSCGIDSAVHVGADEIGYMDELISLTNAHHTCQVEPIVRLFAIPEEEFDEKVNVECPAVEKC